MAQVESSLSTATESVTILPSRNEKIWRFARQMVVLQVGLMFFGLGLALGFIANLGLHPWGLFQNALTRFIPLTYGQINILVGVIMIGVSWFARVPPGIGTLCNAVFVGLWADLFIAIIPHPHSLWLQALVLFLGLWTLAFGSALYIKAGLGAGPRDSFMLAIMRWTGWRVSAARAAMDCTVFVLGAILDFPRVGIGTIIYTFGFAPAIGVTFRLLRIPPRGTTR